jgi:transcriptional regulator with XRE-family HTH domain
MIRDQDRVEIRLTREAEYRLPFTFIESLNEGTLFDRPAHVFRVAARQHRLFHVVNRTSENILGTGVVQLTSGGNKSSTQAEVGGLMVHPAARGFGIPAQIVTPHPGDPSPETTLESLELYEDYKRLNRDPINLMNSRARVAKLLAAKGLTQDEIGKRLGLKKQSVSETKSNSEFALAHPKEVEKCETEYDVKKARLKWQDKEAARHRWALQEITGASFEIIHADFHEWPRHYRGPRFNLGHFDFPYGIGQDQFNQSSRTDARYDDSPEVFERLCDTLERYMDQIFDEDTPSIFWFPIKRIYEVRQRLERMPWQVNPHPLVWVKPTAGIIPVPDRTPRQCVE